MIRVSSRGAAGDPEVERRRVEIERTQSRMMSIQNVVGFVVACTLIRAGPWILELMGGEC